MVILDRTSGGTTELRRASINDDDWYLYDREQDMVVEQQPHRYKPDHTQTPRGLEWIRGLHLKLTR